MALVKDLVQRKNDVQSILQLNDLILTERIRLRVSIRVFTNRANIKFTHLAVYRTVHHELLAHHIDRAPDRIDSSFPLVQPPLLLEKGLRGSTGVELGVKGYRMYGWRGASVISGRDGVVDSPGMIVGGLRGYS